MSKRLAGKNVVITGASRGIGAAVARRFALEGANIIVAHHTDAKMTELAEKLVTELSPLGVEVHAIGADLSTVQGPADLIKKSQERLGTITTLVANAATNKRKEWFEYEVAEWDLMQNVNVRSIWMLAQQARTDLIKSKGSIITVSSIMAETALPFSAAYTTSKAAVLGLTRALAKELGTDGVRVNSVLPGAIRTEWEVEFDPDEEAVRESVYEKQALKVRGYAKDLAGTFVFLASEESSFITGQGIAVDGGWLMR